jgi:hypothetical protein
MAANGKACCKEVAYPYVLKIVTIPVGLEALAGLSRPETNRLLDSDAFRASKPTA